MPRSDGATPKRRADPKSDLPKLNTELKNPLPGLDQGVYE